MKTIVVTGSSGLIGSEAVEHFDRQGHQASPRPGEVYNLGGSRVNSVSMLEAIAKIEHMTGKKLNWKYVDKNRKGDHICYISNLAKFRSHYPHWSVTIGLDEILRQIITDHTDRLHIVGLK
jgi:CDP-paratose 2-epimerase